MEPGPDDSAAGEQNNVTRPAKRPLFERLGMAAIAGVVALLFGGIAVASWIGGEQFLGIMAAAGALMTLWAGGNTLVRG